MLLSVYEGRLTRIMEKQRAELKAIQSERKEAREKAVNQAAIFVEHAESKGKEYDLGEDFQPSSAHGGFVFSPAEIAARRDRRYKAATHCHFRDRSNDQRPNLDPKSGLKAA